MITVITLSHSELINLGHQVESVSEIELADIPKLMLLHKRSEVIKAYCDAYGFTPDEFTEYEGGIDDWIGFGSVTCYELGGGTLVGYGCDELQMVVMKR